MTAPDLSPKSIVFWRYVVGLIIALTILPPYQTGGLSGFLGGVAAKITAAFVPTFLIITLGLLFVTEAVKPRAWRLLVVMAWIFGLLGSFLIWYGKKSSEPDTFSTPRISSHSSITPAVPAYPAQPAATSNISTPITGISAQEITKPSVTQNVDSEITANKAKKPQPSRLVGSWHWDGEGIPEVNVFYSDGTYTTKRQGRECGRYSYEFRGDQLTTIEPKDECNGASGVSVFRVKFNGNSMTLIASSGYVTKWTKLK